MSKNEKLLKKFEMGTQTWSDYNEVLNLNLSDLKHFLRLAYDLKRRTFGDLLKIYIPNKRFPAISITGSECSLHCEHCNKKYLEGMKPILNNDELKKYLMNLHNNDGIGVLLSGGCLPDGSVPLFDYLDSIKEIKAKTNLIINAHTGLLNEDTARKLAQVGVDIVSFDINMDEDIIKDIYHLDKDLEDYRRAIGYMQKFGINIVPHICIGLYYGKLHKELDTIRFIKESGLNPSLIVLIALIPPKNANNKFIGPKPVDIAKIISIIRFAYPNSEISLGCMRPRGNIKIEIEKYAIKAGINRIEIPSKKTLKWAKELYPNITYNFFSACCAIPQKFEKFALSKDTDLKGYL
ncbi:MAG: radical SAM protein [Candidatus Thorarchaeota archaeon]